MKTATTATTAVTMTAEQKLEARRAYAREYYKKHAEQCKAACKKCREAKKAVAAGDVPAIEAAKRGPGRPKKVVKTPAIQPPVAYGAMNPAAKRGRPKKTADVKAVTKPLSKTEVAIAKLRETETTLKQQAKAIEKTIAKLEKELAKERKSLDKISAKQLEVVKKIIELQEQPVK